MHHAIGQNGYFRIHIASQWPKSATIVTWPAAKIFQDLPRSADLNADVSSSSSFCERPSRLLYLPGPLVTSPNRCALQDTKSVPKWYKICAMLAPLNKVQDIFECQINDHSIGSQLWPAKIAKHSRIRQSRATMSGVFHCIYFIYCIWILFVCRLVQ